MSRNYDNWERLVAAVIKREEIWELCHQPSRTPSICSEASSDFGSSFRSSDVDYKSEAKVESSEQSPPKLCFLGCCSTVIPFKGSLNRPHELGSGRFWNSTLVHLKQDVKTSDNEFLASGTELVVKILKEVKVTESEFKQQMMLLGNCRHENVGAPRAFCFSEAHEKVVIYGYHSQGSVSDMLHGDKSCPDWATRLRIAIGAARGIAYIHMQSGGKMAHGYIKSSNIFLNSKKYGCVSEFSLAGIMKVPPKPRGLGYEAAVHEYHQNVSQEMDVYNFGNILLELLTGKSPLQAHGFDKDLHLATWVRSVKPEEWTSMLDQRLRVPFRNEMDLIKMLKTEFLGVNIEANDSLADLESVKAILGSHFQLKGRIPTGYFGPGELKEMAEVLQVAMRCLADGRPKMFEVHSMLESIRSRNRP